jgi:hypothetical protein
MNSYGKCRIIQPVEPKKDNEPRNLPGFIELYGAEPQ